MNYDESKATKPKTKKATIPEPIKVRDESVFSPIWAFFIALAVIAGLVFATMKAPTHTPQGEPSGVEPAKPVETVKPKSDSAQDAFDRNFGR
jgi:hypothetical protein